LTGILVNILAGLFLVGESAVIMSYREDEELELLRKRDQKRKMLAALDALRKEINRQSSLTVEDAYRAAGFSEEVIRDLNTS
jgi:hypothetical protein